MSGPLELSTLAFKVETGQLKAAAEEIANLGEKLKGLNTAISASTLAGKDSVKAAKDNADIAAAEAKTANAALKTEEQKAKTARANLLLEQQKAKGIKAGTQATEEQTAANNRNRASTLQMQEAISAFMLQGRSRGEAGKLAAAQLNGETEETIKLITKQLELQRDLSGPNTFDNSLSGIKKLVVEQRELNEGMEQYVAKSGLTAKQTQELSRDKTRLITRLNEEGATQARIKDELKRLNDEYIREATIVNSRVGTLKEQQRLQRESANALRAVAKEEEKMLSMVTSLTSAENAHMSITEKSAEAQARYARNLKLAGVSGEEATRKLKAHADQQKIIDAVEQKRQAGYLQRGLQPQIGDVAVSLAAGQNPLTVLLQQGDQIRGLISQTQISGELLRETMRNAMTDTVKSIGQTAAAMGSVLGGAVTSLGKAVMTVATGSFKLMNNSLDTMGMSAHVAAFRLQQVKDAWALLGKVGIVAVITAISVALYELYQGMKQHDELVKQINLTGASLGMTASQAQVYAKSISAAGDSGTKMLGVISAMAKEGGFVKDEIKLVGEAALNLYKYGGVAIEDTVKAFSKLKDDPVKALLELSKATGNVSSDVILAVAELTRMGDKAGAVALAMKEMSKANKETVSAMKEEFTGFALFLKDLATDIGNFYDRVIKGIRSLWVKESPAIALQANIDELSKNIAAAEKKGGGGAFNPIGGNPAQLEAAKETLKLMKQSLRYMQEQTEYEQATKTNNANNTDALKSQIDLENKLLSSTEKRANALREAVINGQKLVASGDRTQAQQNKIYAALAKTFDEKTTGVTKPKQAKEETELEKALARERNILNLSNGLTKIYEADKKALDFLLKSGEMSQQQYEDRNQALDQLQPKYIKLQEALKLYSAEQQKLNEYESKTKEENDTLNYRLEILGKTEEQIKKINADRKLQNSLLKAELEYEQERIRLQNLKTDAGGSLALQQRAYELYLERVKAINRGVAVDLVEDYNKAFLEITSTISDLLATAIFEGGEAGTKKLETKIRDMFRKKITIEIDAMVNTFVSEMLGLNGKGEATGATGSLGERFDKFASVLTSKDSILTKEGFANNAAGKIGEAGKFFEKLGDTSETLGDFGKYLSTNSKKLGDYAQKAGGILQYAGALQDAADGKWGKAAGRAIGTAMGSPVLGEIFAGVGEWVDKFFGGGHYVSSTGDSRRTYSATGSVLSTINADGGAYESAKANALVDDLQKQYSSAARSLGITVAASNFKFGSNDSDGGKFALGGGVGSSSFYQAETKLTDEALKLASERAVFAALKGSELPIYLKGIFDNVVASTASSQQINAVLEYAAALKSINAQLQNLPLDGIKNLDFKQLDKLVQQSGGAGSLAQNLSSYYENFLTEEEKKASTLKQIKQVLDAAGGTFSVDQLSKLDRVAFKNLLGTISPDSDLYAALLSVNGAIASITDPLEEAGKAFEDLGKSIEAEIARIRGDIAGTGVEGQASAQMAFTLATAQARAGDQEAAASLPALSQNLLEMAANNASTLQELNAIRAATASSLSATAAIVKSFGITPAVVSTSGVAGIVNAAPVANTINTQAYNTSSNSNTEVLVALEAVASMTNKNYKLLDGVINGENNMRVEVIA